MAELGFVDRCEAVHLLGPPGTGKSHLATALGVEAVKAGRSVYFATLADIIGVLTKAEREGRLREKIRFFCRAALLIVDEIGYLPVTPGGGNLFFQLVNARYEKGAMILTSNRGFAEWGEVFGDAVVATALLDRLLHHGVVIQIEGASYRLRHHAELLPEVRPEHIGETDRRADFWLILPALLRRRGRCGQKELGDLVLAIEHAAPDQHGGAASLQIPVCRFARLRLHGFGHPAVARERAIERERLNTRELLEHLKDLVAERVGCVAVELGD